MRGVTGWRENVMGLIQIKNKGKKIEPEQIRIETAPENKEAVFFSSKIRSLRYGLEEIWGYLR